MKKLEILCYATDSHPTRIESIYRMSNVRAGDMSGDLASITASNNYFRVLFPKVTVTSALYLFR